MVDSLQVFASAGIGVGECERGAVLFGGGVAVSLFLQRLAEKVVRFESGTFFDRRRKIVVKEAHGQGIVATSTEEKTGGVHERLGTVDRGGLHEVEGLLHFVETLGVSQKLRQVQPGLRGSVTGVDRGTVGALGGGFIFLSLGDPSGYIIG